MLAGRHYLCEPFDRKRDLFPYHFWAIPIAIYTGARVNEIAQLRVGDIVEEHGILCFSFNADGHDKSLKTEGSCRFVPVHDHLIWLGFKEFVKQRRAAKGKNGMLFYGLNYDKKNKYGKKISDWFNGNGKMASYLDTCEIEKKGKDFHSFRHTAIQNLTNQDAGEPNIAALVGHEHNTVTSRYGSGIGVVQLLKIVNSIDYGLDLKSLDFDKFMEFAQWKGRPEHGDKVLNIEEDWLAKTRRRK